MALTFDVTRHQYTHNGIVVPSVTQVLNEWVKVNWGQASFYVNTFNGNAIDTNTFEQAGEVGTSVHKGADIIVNGRRTNWPKFDPKIVHPLIEFTRWVKDYKVKAVLSETPLYSKKLGIAGSLDLICTIKGKPTLILVDFKTSATAPLVGPQTAGYEVLYRENYSYRGVIKRYALYLPKDESKGYRFMPLTDKDDIGMLKSKLYEYNFKRRK
jgi:hypothetical protein